MKTYTILTFVSIPKFGIISVLIRASIVSRARIIGETFQVTHYIIISYLIYTTVLTELRKLYRLTEILKRSKKGKLGYNLLLHFYSK